MQFRTLLSTASAAVMALGMMAGTAQANDVTIEQVGSDNTAFSDQDGTNNRSFVRQQTDGNAVGFDTGPGQVLTTGAAQSGANNDTFIQQTGNNFNWATAAINGDTNEVFIRQNGLQNSSTISEQLGNRNRFLVLQNTDRNQVIDALSTGNRNTAVFLQSGGNGNIANFNDAGLFGSGGDDRTYGAIQDGTNNFVGGFGAMADPEDTTVGNSLVAGGTFNLAAVDIGSQTTVDVTEMGNFATAGPDFTGGRGGVTGDNNFALVEQAGFQNRMGLQVIGNNNEIVGSGLGTVTSLNMNTASAGGLSGPNPGADPFNGFRFDDNSVSIPGTALASQNGDSNAAGIVQNGSLNTLEFDQFGNSNVASILQNGNSNEGSAIQNGSGNTLTLISTGNSNSNVIHQNGDNNVAQAIQTQP